MPSEGIGEHRHVDFVELKLHPHHPSCPNLIQGQNRHHHKIRTWMLRHQCSLQREAESLSELSMMPTSLEKGIKKLSEKGRPIYNKVDAEKIRETDTDNSAVASRSAYMTMVKDLCLK